jgi:hypothetical protein
LNPVSGAYAGYSYSGFTLETGFYGKNTSRPFIGYDYATITQTGDAFLFQKGLKYFIGKRE